MKSVKYIQNNVVDGIFSADWNFLQRNAEMFPQARQSFVENIAIIYGYQSGMGWDQCRAPKFQPGARKYT